MNDASQGFESSFTRKVVVIFFDVVKGNPSAVGGFPINDIYCSRIATIFTVGIEVSGVAKTISETFFSHSRGW